MSYVKQIKLNNTNYPFGGNIFNGQWTFKYLSLSTKTSGSAGYNLGTTSVTVGGSTYSALNYLPDSTYDYEVLFNIYAYTSSTSTSYSSYHLIGVGGTPLMNSTYNRVSVYVTNNMHYDTTNCIFPIRAKTLLYEQISGNTLTEGAVFALGYRRIGTNE